MAITEKQHYTEAISHLRAARAHAEAVDELSALDLIDETLRMLRAHRDDSAKEIVPDEEWMRCREWAEIQRAGRADDGR